MSEFTVKESYERLLEGLKRAASCAREFAEGSGNMQWMEISFLIDQMRKNGERLRVVKALSGSQVESVIEHVLREQDMENTGKTMH